MLQIKKYPWAKLENYSGLFLQIGLVLTLFCTLVVLEHKTYERIIDDFTTVSINSDEMEELVITHRVQPKYTAPPPPPQTMEILEIVDNDKDIVESVIESNETDESIAVETHDRINLDNIEEFGEGEEIIEDVPFAVIEEAPIFPGCKGTKQELRKCFSTKISNHVNSSFDANLAQNLQLSEGKKKIFVVFTINSKGNIDNIMARAPHPSLQTEAIRVIKTLPKIVPGKQRGNPVNVKYSLPITFQVIL
jgi:protein TonB